MVVLWIALAVYAVVAVALTDAAYNAPIPPEVPPQLDDLGLTDEQKAQVVDVVYGAPEDRPKRPTLTACLLTGILWPYWPVRHAVEWFFLRKIGGE